MDSGENPDLVGRTVWIVETGCYENRYISGVFASAEAAMAAHPPKPVRQDHVPSALNASRPGGWQHDIARGWAMRDVFDPEGGPYEPDEFYEVPDHFNNGLDWDDAASCYPRIIQGGPE